MPLNRQEGNMYEFVDYTWNVIKGKCPHDCDYCYMKKFKLGDLHFDENELKTDLGEFNFIFVGSSCDMFADVVPKKWIKKVLRKCWENPKNKYLFQTKNPKRFFQFEELSYPLNTIFGATIETNRKITISNAPQPIARANELRKIDERKMVTIEPIMDFDLEPFINFIKQINPEFVNIGADSKGHNLPEPSAEKIGKLIRKLEEFTKVNLKDNLKRIYPNE